MRLVRSGLGKTNAHENPAFRDAARRLSPIRDAEATLETYDGLINVFGGLIDQQRCRTIRTEFEHHKDAIEQELDVDERLSEYLVFCEDRLGRIETWKLHKEWQQGGRRRLGADLRAWPQ